MKINSDTHKIMVVPKTYLFLSKEEGDEYELLPEKYWLKFLVPKKYEIFDLNFMWLLERGYLISPPEFYTMGIPTITVESLRKIVVCDKNLWMCNCQINPLNLNIEGERCPVCGQFNYGFGDLFDCSDVFSFIKPEKLWGVNWENPEFDGEKYRIGGEPITSTWIMEKNKYSANRELLYRMPPKTVWEILVHIFKGTIFSPFKKITRKEVELHASKLLSI